MYCVAMYIIYILLKQTKPFWIIFNYPDRRMRSCFGIKKIQKKKNEKTKIFQLLILVISTIINN